MFNLRQAKYKDVSNITNFAWKLPHELTTRPKTWDMRKLGNLRKNLKIG